MSLEQVRAFVSVVDCGSITAAARSLHVSQPPLSRALRALEDELGEALFERSRRGTRLTPAGQRFLPHALTIMAAVERGRRSVRAAPTPAGALPRHPAGRRER